ncbi:MAG: hypothetical protein H6R14_1061 [Proteobacteria bacterium]|nr:hypothetical protein [Pseudomonadota bacterium]
MSIRLLYLNTHRLAAYTWRQGHLHLEGAFDNNEEGFRLFADYLADRRGSQYAMLANVAEEGHVLESIPFLHGRDRRTLIARKFGQHFLGTPLATAVSLGYEKTQRKNEKLLLSALTNPAHFDPWLRRIKDAEIALSGIFTAAQLGGQLLGKLGQPSNRCLLLTLQDSSIRESYLVDGHAHFSRMAPLADSSIAGIASAFVAESGKLHQYLIGQRLIGRDESLPAYIVAQPLTIPAIEKICPEHGPLNYTLIDSHVAAQKLKLHTLPGDNRSDMLLLHLLATAPPRQQFANDAHRHHFRLAQIRHVLIASGLIALLGSVLFAAKGTYDAQNLRAEASALRATEADLNRRYLEISATFPQLGVDNETLRRLTNRYAELIVQQRQPGPSYRAVSRVLDRMPAITLESIDWKNGQNFRLTVGSSREDAEITTVRGAIRLERATTRQTLAVFDQFVDALKADPANTVNILQRPFDIESGQSLRGGDSQEGETQARQFAVEIVRGKAP